MGRCIIVGMGLIYLLGYVLIVGAGTFGMKFVMQDLSPFQINFLMAIGMMVVAVPALYLSQGNLHVPAKVLPLGILIGLSMTIGSILFVFALTKLPVGPASAISTAYIIVALILSVIFLKDKLDAITIIGLVLALTGIAILSLKVS